MTDLLELYHMANQANIVVDCFELGKREALSIIEPDGNCYIAIDPFQLTSSQDEKLKLAHELGHCATGSFYNQWDVCDIRQKYENRADKWAIQCLVPEVELEEAISAGHTQLWDLAEYFGVTEDFMRKAICWYTYGNLASEIYF